jgi:hypothetical protein
MIAPRIYYCVYPADANFFSYPAHAAGDKAAVQMSTVEAGQAYLKSAAVVSAMGRPIKSPSSMRHVSQAVREAGVASQSAVRSGFVSPNRSPPTSARSTQPSALGFSTGVGAQVRRTSLPSVVTAAQTNTLNAILSPTHTIAETSSDHTHHISGVRDSASARGPHLTLPVSAGHVHMHHPPTSPPAGGYSDLPPLPDISEAGTPLRPTTSPAPAKRLVQRVSSAHGSGPVSILKQSTPPLANRPLGEGNGSAAIATTVATTTATTASITIPATSNDKPAPT